MDHEDPSAQGPDPDLTIGELARRTGLTPAVLRMWEARHGFPVPRRLASGHRRFSEADVELVQQVLRRKDSGVRLEVAIAEAAGSRAPTAPSIFATLRRRHTDLLPQRLRKSTLIGLSWAIEDECSASGERPVLFGAFQRGAFYASSAARWAELARIARSTIVFADDWDPGSAEPAATNSRTPRRGPIRATLAADAPMSREWAVVCDVGGSAACLSAWELPGQSEVPDRHRIFETVWTVDPVAVRDASRAAAGVALAAGVTEAEPLLADLERAPTSRIADTRESVALFNRVVAYVDRLA